MTLKGKKYSRQRINSIQLVLAFLTKQNPKKYIMSWLFYSCKIVYILALMIIVLGKIADILKKNRKKLEDKSIMVKSQL